VGGRWEAFAVPDVYASIAQVDTETQARLAGTLELRAADPQRRAMLDADVGEIDFAPSARTGRSNHRSHYVDPVVARRAGS
jgi:hypothetical protein